MDKYYCITVDNSSEHLVYPQTQETLDRWKANLNSKEWIEEFKTIRKISSLDEVKPIRFDPNKLITNINIGDKISFIDFIKGEKRVGIVLTKGIETFEQSQNYYFISVKVKISNVSSNIIYATNHLIYPQNAETLEVWNTDDKIQTLKVMKEFESIRKIS